MMTIEIFKMFERDWRTEQQSGWRAWEDDFVKNYILSGRELTQVCCHAEVVAGIWP